VADGVEHHEMQVHAKPVIVNGRVHVDFGNGFYIDMEPDVSKEFGRQMIVAGMKAEGQSGHLFILPVPK
jgi:hypothetical protein